MSQDKPRRRMWFSLAAIGCLHLTFLKAPGISRSLAQSVRSEPPATCWPTRTLSFAAGTREARVETFRGFPLSRQKICPRTRIGQGVSRG